MKIVGTPESLAAAIADSLFVNFFGDRAERLVLTVDGPPKRDLGGWSQVAITTRITTIIANAQEPV